MIAIPGFFLSLLSGSALLGALCGRRFERTLPLTVFSGIFLLYVFGLFDALKAGAAVVGALALLCWLAALAYLLKTKTWRAFAASFFTPAFCIYAALFVLSCVWNYGREITAWDDLTHWADVVRQMCSIHAFGASAKAVCFFPNYPPAMALLQYFVQRLHTVLTGAPFSEWLLFPAYSAALYALFMPFLSRLCYKNWFTNLCLLAAVFLLPGTLHRSLFRLLDIDPFLGTLAGCGLAMAALAKNSDPFDMLTCALAAFVLTLSKGAGVCFGVLIVAAMVLGAMQKGERAHMKRLWPGAAAAILTAFAWLSWERYMTLNHTYRAFSGAIDIGALWRILAHQEGGYRAVVWQSFWKEIFAPVYPVGILELGFSFFALLLILAAVALVLWLLRGRKADPRLCRILWLGFIAAILYAVGMCFVYMFRFSAYEALELASFDRYMGVALLMLTSLLFAVGVASMEAGKPQRRLVAAALIALLLFAAPAQEAASLALGRNRAYSAGVRAPVDECAAHIRPTMNESDKKLNVVALDSDGLDFLMFRFLLRPQRVSGAWSMIRQRFNPADIWYDPPLDVADWRARLIAEDYGYVLLYRVDDAFLNNFAPLFSGCVPREGGLYAFHADSGLLYETAQTAEKAL